MHKLTNSYVYELMLFKICELTSLKSMAYKLIFELTILDIVNSPRAHEESCVIFQLTSSLLHYFI